MAMLVFDIGSVRKYMGSRIPFFFFSSRRRHTRFDCDWSSDVCSSDLSMPLSGSCEEADDLLVAVCDVRGQGRSEEHTSELQSQSNLVCRLLLEKKKAWRRAPMRVRRSRG